MNLGMNKEEKSIQKIETLSKKCVYNDTMTFFSVHPGDANNLH